MGSRVFDSFPDLIGDASHLVSVETWKRPGNALDHAPHIPSISGDDMNVNVGNLLPALPPVVDANGCRWSPHRLLDPPHDHVESRKEVSGVLLGQILDFGYVGLGDEERMAWGRGVDVEEGQSLLVFVYLVGWNLPIDYGAKDAAINHIQFTLAGGALPATRDL